MDSTNEEAVLYVNPSDGRKYRERMLVLLESNIQGKLYNTRLVCIIEFPNVQAPLSLLVSTI